MESKLNGRILTAAYLLTKHAEPLEIAIKGLNEEEMKALKAYVKNGSFIKA